MFYKLAHILRDCFPWLWEMIEWLNGWLFASLYGQCLRHVVFCLHGFDENSLFRLCRSKGFLAYFVMDGGERIACPL